MHITKQEFGDLDLSVTEVTTDGTEEPGECPPRLGLAEFICSILFDDPLPVLHWKPDTDEHFGTARVGTPDYMWAQDKKNADMRTLVDRMATAQEVIADEDCNVVPPIMPTQRNITRRQMVWDWYVHDKAGSVEDAIDVVDHFIRTYNKLHEEDDDASTLHPV
jgi:hypothetical protein